MDRNEQKGNPNSEQMENKMDNLDRQILDIIQSGFPLVARPYAQLGSSIGLTEEEAYQRVKRMRETGIIRRIGANFQSSRLGFVSTLCAAKVSQDKIEDFIALINACPGVTHNYERNHAYNIWFTLISPSREAENETLAELTMKSGIEILNLPATKLYKIRVDFPMGE